MQQALSLVRNCKPGLSHGVILALLLLASAPGPALAQAQCPASPTVTISSQLPSDVCIPAGFAGNPIAFFDDFSWRSFIAMVWPVQQGQRGVPDTGQSIGPVSGPLVFETLKADWEVFQPSPDGTSPPPAPSAWNSYAGQNPCSQFGASNVGFGDMVLASFSKYGNLGEAGFGNLAGSLPTQYGTYTRYFTAFNQTEFQQILGQNLYLRSNFPASPPGVTFQPGALDLKAAWIDMTNVPNPERYYTRTAWVMNPFTTPTTCTEITVGLVGLHIVQKTPTRPQWIWSTFEQIDNVPGGASQGPFTYNNGTAQPPPQTATMTNPNPWPPTASPTMVNVERLTPINTTSTAKTNAQYQAALQAKGGPWQYYQLVMTQWPKQASQPALPGSPPNTFPGSGATTAFANVALETFDQATIFKGCMACHTNAQKTTDFLWSLEVNAWPSTITPPSAPPLFARGPSPDADAALAAPTLPEPLAALKKLMESAATTP